MATSRDPLSEETARIEVGPTIETAVEVCRQGDWQRGLALLWKASRKAASGGGEELPAAFYSYTGFGMARYQNHLAEGERRCLQAVELDPNDPENLLLLAEVRLLRRNREGAIEILRQGLEIAPDDPALLRLERRIGFRRPPVLSFLSRDNFLNRFLGRRRHRRDDA